MDQRTEVLSRTLFQFLARLRSDLPRMEIDKLKLELASLNDRLGRVERSLSRLEPGLIPGRAGRKIKRVSLKDRVVRQVAAHPEGVETGQISLALGVALKNVALALRQALDEGLIRQERRGFYIPVTDRLSEP